MDRRGLLGADVEQPAAVFVFEGLIAQLDNPKLEAHSLKKEHWGAALKCWSFDYQVCDYIHGLLSRQIRPIRVLTWHGEQFAKEVHDELWRLDCPVEETKSSEYRIMSPRLAVDPSVDTVYDADPAHQYGYGFKQRALDFGTP